MHPKRRVGVAVGWAVMIVVTLMSALTGFLASQYAKNRSLQRSEQTMRHSAIHIHDLLAANIANRLQVLETTSSHLEARAIRDPAELSGIIGKTVERRPEFSWFGITDSEGNVIASSGDLLLGENVTQKEWFADGRQHSFVGEVLKGRPQEPMLPASGDGNAPGFIHLAVPVRLTTGGEAAVLAAHLSHDWLLNVKEELLVRLYPDLDVELILASEDNTVITGPENWVTGPLPAEGIIRANGEFVSGRATTSVSRPDILDWTVVLRKPVQTAIRTDGDNRIAIALSALAGGPLAGLVAILVATFLLKRLRKLASQTRQVASGDRDTIDIPPGEDEVHQIGSVLAGTISSLTDERNALQNLNADLDKRVEERTDKVKQLMVEARFADINRDRLQLARDLHDTLAHSMMAVLTQIRVVRKLANRISKEELDKELEDAETIASEGMVEARDAIAQIRSYGIKDSGLGAALTTLLRKVADRTGIKTEIAIDEHCAKLSDERAATVLRISQEALRNMEKHANASKVRVEVAALGNPPDRQINIAITDNGAGFDMSTSREGHYGISGMQEQIAMIDGNIVIDSTPGSGTCIKLSYIG